MKRALVRKGAYFDSVFLMSLGGEVKATAGVSDALVSMGTALNLDLLRSRGYPEDELAPATPNDLVIAVEAADEAAVQAAVAAATALLERQVGPSKGGASAPRPTSLEGALRLLPGANLAVISLPGAYAAREARRALERGLHVMLFSDNVSLEEEIALKELGRARGRLVMGPDCGTAIVNGKPLCFANVVRPGPVGLVAASGTGLQEVTCLVDRFGSGVSQALGTGGRDLKDERVGGITMLMGIEALAADPATRVIVVLSKPPAPAVAEKVVAALAAARKPAVVHFVGGDAAPPDAPPAVHFASHLEEAASFAVSLAQGGRPAASAPPASLEALAAREGRRISGAQRYLRGYFTGGTLADEAMVLLHRALGQVYSNNQTDARFLLADPRISRGHTVVDLGDDAFTVGRPHPMIDPGTRTERILAEAADPEIALLLVDLVLGYGSHPDPAGALVPALAEARRMKEVGGGYLPVVASVVGTPGDVQGYAAQRRKLEEAGCLVMDSNYQASLLTLRILETAGRR